MFDAKIIPSIFCDTGIYMIYFLCILKATNMIEFFPTLGSLIELYSSPVFLWVLLCITVLLTIGFFLRRFPDGTFAVAFDILFETVVKFYGDILGEESWKHVRMYIVTLFFVILIANMLGVILDFIAPIFGTSPTWDFFLTRYIHVPTADMQFNIALALFSTLLLVFVQFRSLGIKNFAHTYFPITGKGYIVVSQWKMRPYIYYPVMVIAKLADIIISFFLAFLDIIGLFAKVISLAFRLFGNMTSGTILLGMLIVGTSNFSNSITAFMGGINFPIIAPIIVYLQEFLVACIQAMVFPLLVAIFIRMAQIGSQSNEQIEA